MKKLFVLLCVLFPLVACTYSGTQTSQKAPTRTNVSTQEVITIQNTSQSHPTVVPTLTTTPTLAITETPSPTLTATVTPTPTQRPSFYTVKKGDTLDDIAAKFDLPTNFLAKRNNIDNPNYIYIDQILAIPAEYIPETTAPLELLPGKMIVVILSEQKTYAYEDGKLIASFLISSGLPEHPTILGDYETYIKLESTTMSGEGYYLEKVPWTMYFYQGYGFHGTYWHHNFGTPMSHGCINMYTPDAEWLYHWAPIGTHVRVIP